MKTRSLIVLLALFVVLGCSEIARAAFVSLEQEAGVWWFKSPEGKQFLSIGANHVEPIYWQSPNNKAWVQATYGPGLFSPDGVFQDGSPAAEQWARRIATNFNHWGFNTFGFHNPLSKSLRAASRAYYVVELNIPVPWGWNMARSTLLRAFQRRPTDVFGAAFVATVEAHAAELVKPRAADPQVLGYAYTDGPPWTVTDEPGTALTSAEKNIHPWVLALMSLPAEAKGKQAWLALMKERYASPEKVGATYACPAATWDELAAKITWTALTDTARAAEDSQAFLLKIMRQWYAVRKNAIRKYDQHHLILGDKLNMNRDAIYPEQLIQSLRVMTPYVDVINIQYYGLFDKQREALALINRETQMPILNGDTTFMPFWKDPNAHADKYYREVGQTYAAEIQKLFALPYFVGWHHCGYMRGLRPPYREALKRGDRQAIEFYEKRKITLREGLLTEHEEPIEAFTKPLSAAVKNCEKLHRAAGASEQRP